MAPMSSFALLAVLLCVGPAPAAAQYSKLSSDMSPIRKVVTLIEEMKAQVEKDAKADLEAYDKYMCWCETNEKAKTKAVADAETKIDELTAFLEESTARSGELKTEIAQLETDIAEDQDALAAATENRNKENEEFLAVEADLTESIKLLTEALDVLGKVNLLQKSGQKPSKELVAKAQATSEALIQMHKSNTHGVQGRFPEFESTMKRDLFDMLGSLASEQSFLMKKRGASFSQASLLPWEKTEEQKGKEVNPNELEGAAAGAKSYNSRSGRIFGLLSEMNDEMKRDLVEAQKAEATAVQNFNNLKAAKEGEIAAATKQKDQDEAELADLTNKMANANKDLEATKDALAADNEFLANMKTDCKNEDEEYKARVEIRSKELVALAETIKILTDDDARELFGKTTPGAALSFLQTSAEAMMQDKAMERAMQRIAATAKKTKNWALVSLAVQVRLDAFTKVKQVMEKMLAELKKQQQEEYEKNELCKKEIDATEDSIKEKKQVKSDLSEKHTNLVNEIETLKKSIEELKKDEADMMVALKQAGEERKEQNGVYMTSVMDQRAAINILNKALKRLKMFYTELVQVQQPGQPVAPPPPSGKAYQKSAGAGGVVQIMMEIIREAEQEEQKLDAGEQKAQADYATFVKDTGASIEADRAAIEEKTALLASTETEKSETEEAQLANGVELDKLAELLHNRHLDCDYVLKYFDMRQQARKEEMDSITDAKAILSGADFGK